MIRLFLVTLILCGVGTFTYAATDNFTVRMLIGSDTTPPTTPTSLVATPVATTQIDLLWGASSDDFLLGGYQVFRDASQIATTTLTSYSDSGLTASTTYSYYVIAFDDAFNYSSSSNVASTTTLPLTSTSTPPTDDNGGAGPNVDLVSLSITPDIYEVTLAWETNRYAQFELRWGRTSSYELGFVSNELFKRKHITSITDLEPGTTYEYQLIAYDHDGDRFLLSADRFKTLSIPDDIPPSNVSNLTADVKGADVLLTWSNPLDPDFSYIRIVRNHLFYPTDMYDGYIAYQGSRDSFFDNDAFNKSNIQHYTVFAVDKKGNISSGAIVTANKNKTEQPDETVSVLPELNLNFSNIEIVQDNLVIEKTNINADEPFTVRLAYEKLPEHLKTITVILGHPQDPKSQFSFLLRINKDKTYYEATIAPLRVSGLYPTTVTVFDYELSKLHTIEGELGIEKKEEKEVLFGVPLTTAVQLPPFLIIFASLLFLLIILYLLYKFFVKNRRTKKSPQLLQTPVLLQSLLLVFASSGILVVSYITFSSTDILQQSSAVSLLESIPREAFAAVILLALIFFGIVFYVLINKNKSNK